MTHIKVCGITRLDDAKRCLDLGIEAIGLNFWPGSPRCIEVTRAQDIVKAMGDAIQVVAVTVNATLAALLQLRQDTGISWLQLHGDEPPELVQQLLPYAYKALPVHGPEVLLTMQRYPGEHLLLDAASTARGGSGQAFDWSIAAQAVQQAAATQRSITLAGGLRPDNVAEAIAVAQPHRVDVASGVESAPGHKDPAKLAAFVRAVRA